MMTFQKHWSILGGISLAPFNIKVDFYQLLSVLVLAVHHIIGSSTPGIWSGAGHLKKNKKKLQIKNGKL